MDEEEEWKVTPRRLIYLKRPVAVMDDSGTTLGKVDEEHEQGSALCRSDDLRAIELH